MHTGDNNQPDTEPDLVRVLPSNGVLPLPHTPGRDPKPARRWWPVGVGSLVAVAAAGVFMSAPDQIVTTSTTPPPISATPADPVDLTRSGTNQLTDPWTVINVPDGAQFNDMIRSDDLVVAVGQQDGLAQAWFSTNGASWNPANQFEPAVDTATSQLHTAVPWGGKTLGIGGTASRPAVWIAAHPGVWDYEGDAPFAGDLGPAIVAGEQLLAVVETEDGHEGWLSDDGVSWDSVGLLDDLSGIFVPSYAAFDGWYYVMGLAYTDGAAVIYRSIDGRSWSPTDGAGIGSIASESVIVDMAATDEGLIAIGSAVARPAMWVSPDGSTWKRSGGVDSGAFGPRTADIELIKVSPGAGLASLSINGSQHRLAAGSQVNTDGGTIVVTEIGQATINVTIDGISQVIGLADPKTIQRTPEITAVTAEGRRIVIVGTLHSKVTFDPIGRDIYSEIPVVWTSTDRGMTWEMTALAAPPHSWASHAALIRGNIVVTGFSEPAGETLAWRSAWNTEADEKAAIAAIEGFFAAISSGDSDVLSMLDTTWTTGSAFQLPGLGRIDLNWWTGDSRVADLDAVSETLDYLVSVGTRVETENCRTKADSRLIDTVEVTCDFTVSSGLLDSLGPKPALGDFQARVDDGLIKNLTISNAPSSATWLALADWAVTEEPAEAAATVVSIPANGPWEFDPTLTRESAAIHLAMARDLKAISLLPGMSRIVETAFGTMEWTWMAEPPAGVTGFAWVTFIDGTYLAGSEPAFDGSVPMRLWQSDDGVSWDSFPEPGVFYIEAPVPFGDGLLTWGVAGPNSNLGLWVYDAGDWTEVPFDHDQSTARIGPRALAVSGVRGIISISLWDEMTGEPIETQAWRLDVDGTLEPVTLPDAITPGSTIGLTGTDNGFTLATGGGVWRSVDGISWNRVTAQDNLPSGVHFWGLSHHDGTYVIGGVTNEQLCVPTLPFCVPDLRLWTSSDAVSWSLVVTGDGQPVPSGDVSSGPMGLTALGQSSFGATAGPQTVYVSPPGGPWSVIEDLRIHDPGARRWWLGQPAIGANSILIAGQSVVSDDFSQTQPILIIGRVIDEG